MPLNRLLGSKPSGVFEKYLNQMLSVPCRKKDGSLLVHGLPSHDAFIRQPKEGVRFPERALEKEAQKKVRQIIATPLVQLPKGMKKVAFTHEGVEAYLIGTPVGDKHQRVQWVKKDGTLLHEAVMANDDFPNVLVVDEFLEKDSESHVSHGVEVTKFLERFNPFLNIEKVQYQVGESRDPNSWREILNRLKTGERIDAINHSIVMKPSWIKKQSPEQIKTVMRSLFSNRKTNSLHQLKLEKQELEDVERLLKADTLEDLFAIMLKLKPELTEHISDLKRNNSHTLESLKRELESSVTNLKENISALEHNIKIYTQEDTLITDLRQVSNYGRNPLAPNTKQKVSLYKGSGNFGLDESKNEGYHLVSPDVASHDGYVVGGTLPDGTLHPETNGGILVNKTAPYSFNVTHSEEGINITGGDPKVDGIDISPEDMGKSLFYYNAIIRSNLPEEISGTSFSSPTTLSLDWLPVIAETVRKNEGKLPNQLPPKLLKLLDSLSTHLPKQGPPSY